MTTGTIPTAINFPFDIDLNRSIRLCSTYEMVVRAQVIDALMTNQSERVMRPRYGCDIQSALFDPADELVRHDAGNLIRDRLQKQVPRCIVRSIKVTAPTEMPGYVIVDILYRPSLYATDQNLQVPVSSEFLNRYRQELTP